MDAEDDPIKLSEHTLVALRTFQEQQEAEKEQFAVLQARAQSRFSQNQDSQADFKLQSIIPEIDLFKEDWQLSQFWYSSATADALAQELLNDPTTSREAPLRVGVLCAPSVYPKLLTRNASDVWLFEFDIRFEVLAGEKFVKYDYNFPLQLPIELKGSFDRLIVDPPFLSDECEVKAATTARWLSKPDARLLICSGAKMRDLLLRIYKAHETKFKVEHNSGRLSNDFLCLTNYFSENVEQFGPIEDKAICHEYSSSSSVA